VAIGQRKDDTARPSGQGVRRICDWLVGKLELTHDAAPGRIDLLEAAIGQQNHNVRTGR
jgi:hypothetical protein